LIKGWKKANKERRKAITGKTQPSKLENGSKEGTGNGGGGGDLEKRPQAR